MKIIVCGCGKIGVSILSSLAAEGHDLVALDDDPAVIAEVTNIYDVIGVRGNGADCETLEDAGVRDAELFIAVTGSDELNMLACFLARRMGAGHTIARIRNPEYNDASLDFMKRELELSMAIFIPALMREKVSAMPGMRCADSPRSRSSRSAWLWMASYSRSCEASARCMAGSFADFITERMPLWPISVLLQIPWSICVS